MKTRQGFVSNSSSSSFIIGLHDLSALQLDKIKSHFSLASEMSMECMGYCSEYDSWAIEITRDFVRGSTGMDNFNMGEFLEKIGIDPDTIRWGE